VLPAAQGGRHLEAGHRGAAPGHPAGLLRRAGSHEPDARELDSVLMGRATVVVESRATALREAGDVVMAIHEGALDPDDLVTLADPAGSRGEIHADRPLVVKTCGMGWQDLVVAVAAYRRKEGTPEERS
ncbi:hypothetical protein ACFV9X_14645, partial [Streptomyces anulatus]